MRYSKAVFRFQFDEAWQQDLFVQQLFDIGFDTLDDSTAYIRSELLDHKALSELAAQTEGVELLRTEDCPDENWNATWEAEHPVENLPMGVQIVPHCAFGAGHHETTGMLIEALMEPDNQALLHDANVLDMGCGTGVLGIYAMRLGAQNVVAIDIDESSVRSTEENAARNAVRIDARLGDTPEGGPYRLILSNIHRNILLRHMSVYADKLQAGGELWLSGFYEEDCAPLQEAAEACSLRWLRNTERGEWRMMQLKK